MRLIALVVVVILTFDWNRIKPWLNDKVSQAIGRPFAINGDLMVTWKHAEGETGHAFGHFDFLSEVGDPVTGVKVGATPDNLKSAIEGETYEYTEMYPGFARTARDEGFEEIAEWLETLARAEKSHAGRFTQGLETVS